MSIYTYRFPTHWTTTEEELVGYIERFELTPGEQIAIDEGELPNVVIDQPDPLEEQQ
jgi:hypothetical protein